MKALAKRGHRVDVVTVFPQKKPYPNYMDIVIPPPLPKMVNNMTYDYFTNIPRNEEVQFFAEKGGNNVCEKGLAHPNIQKLIKNPPTDPPYDVVITELFTAHCFFIFGYHLNVPVVAMSSAMLYPWGNDLIGNPENLAFVPNNLVDFVEHMNFWKRLSNVVYNTYVKWNFNRFTLPQDEILKKHFGSNAPGIRELERNLSLVLTNSHIVLNGAKPTTPALVEVGGLHVQDEGPDIPAVNIYPLIIK